MRFLLLGICLFSIVVTAGCVSDMPTRGQIKAEIENHYKGEGFDRKPTRIKILEIVQTGNLVRAVVDVEGKIVHQVSADSPMRFAARHDLDFQWLGCEWKCTKNIPSDYNK